MRTLRHGLRTASGSPSTSGSRSARRLGTAGAGLATLLLLLAVPAAQADDQCGVLTTLTTFEAVFLHPEVNEQSDSGVTVTVAGEGDGGVTAFAWESDVPVVELVLATGGGEQVVDAGAAEDGQVEAVEGSHIESAAFCIQAHELTIEALDAVAETPIAGIDFEVLADDGDGSFSPDTDDKVGGCVTDEEGACSVPELPPGSYWVSPTSPDGAKVLEDPLGADIVDGPVTVTASIELADQRHVFLQLTNHDPNTAPLLEGTQFQLTRSGKQPDEGLRATCVTTADGVCLFVDEQGQAQDLGKDAVFDIWRAQPAPKDLPVGRVRVGTDAKGSLHTDAEPITVFTGATRNPAPKELERGEELRDVLIDATVTNLTLPHSEVTVVTKAKGKPDSRLNGAEFALWIDRNGDERLDRDADFTTERTCRTGAADEAGMCTFTALPAGDYLLVQTGAPSDFQTGGDEVTPVTLGRRDRTVTVTNPPTPASLTVSTAVSTDGGESWLEADDGSSPLVDAGDDVGFQVTVRNTGGRKATDLTLSGEGLSLDGCEVPASLASGSSFDCRSAFTPAASGQHRVSVTATAKDISASDSARYFGVSPGLKLDVTPDRTTAHPGDTVTYIYDLTNTGNTRLRDLHVTDERLGEITLPDTTLDAGKSLTGATTLDLTTADAAAGKVATFATASGHHPDGSPATAAAGSLLITSTPACPEGQIPEGEFADVAAGNVHGGAIDCLAWWGLTRGTGDGYQPASSVTRAQMASFITRLLEAAGVDLGAGTDRFSDDDGSVHESAIDKLAEADVAQGVSAGGYDPEGRVTRAQMASFIVRAHALVSGDLPPVIMDRFADDGSVHEANINRAAEAGLVHGAEPGTYDPHRAVRRDQMASFLTRLMDRMRKDAMISVTP